MLPILLAATLSLSATADSTSLPAAEILVPGLKTVQVKAKVVARLMNREWQLRQNRNDSLDFSHVADSSLVAGLFRIPFRKEQRVFLRFGMRQAPEGVHLRLSSFLTDQDSTGRRFRATSPADTAALRQSLEAIQQEEFGPGSLIPSVDAKKRKAK